MLKNGLKSKDFRIGEVHHNEWWTPLFCFFRIPLVEEQLGLGVVDNFAIMNISECEVKL